MPNLPRFDRQQRLQIRAALVAGTGPVVLARTLGCAVLTVYRVAASHFDPDLPPVRFVRVYKPRRGTGRGPAHNGKLSAEAVRAIRASRRGEGRTLAARYGLDNSVISRVRKRALYRHIPDLPDAPPPAGV